MRLADLRAVGSMRARMTAGFVLVLAPCLVILSVYLPVFSQRAAELKDQRQVGWIAERVIQRMAAPNWRERLAEFVEANLPRSSHVAVLIVDENGTPVWRSPGPRLPWPLLEWADWRRELRQRRERAEAEAAAKTALLSPSREGAPGNRATGEGQGDQSVERSREATAQKESAGKARAEERALAEARATAHRAVDARLGGDDWRVVGLFGVGPERRAWTLVIAQDWGAVVRDRVAQKRLLLLLSLCVVLGVAAGTWVLVGRTLSPIRRLALQADAASVENLQVRLKAPSGDAEVVELVDTLNGLLTRLAETAAVKGRFYAAASHELRTPLQALSGHLEVALSRSRTAEEYETFLQEASRQTGRLTSLVKDLLLLHQLDSIHGSDVQTGAARGHPAPQVTEPIDLGQVCETVLAQLAPLIEARALRFEADLGDGIEIRAAPSHAQILVRNLVENAVKYASEGGAVTLCLTAGGPARLELFNECLLAPEWSPQKLFEPFYRPDAARNARTGGNGLGLAICRAVAAANGWTVTLEQEARGVRAVAAFGAAEGGAAGPPG
jgi:signal transduction histidine kinase